MTLSVWRITAGLLKTFLLHSETEPKLDGGGALIVNGDQALRVMSLAPPSKLVRVGGAVGQHRLS